MPDCQACGAKFSPAQQTCQSCGAEIQPAQMSSANSLSRRVLIELLVTVATFAFAAFLMYIFR